MDLESADAVTIRPQLAPIDGRDAAIVVGIGLLVPLAMFAVALLASRAVYSLTERWWIALGPWIAFLAVALFAHANEVRSLRVDAEGITFQRWLGVPRHLPWSQVRRIRRAPPREVILHGWLWPLVPPREATRSMTTEGHYAIEYGAGRVTYYPPIEEYALLDAAHRWGADVVR